MLCVSVLSKKYMYVVIVIIIADGIGWQHSKWNAGPILMLNLTRT
jgi:hypothetical protein